eukprot:4577965-Prymnesium_polylepis.1
MDKSSASLPAELLAGRASPIAYASRWEGSGGWTGGDRGTCWQWHSMTATQAMRRHHPFRLHRH